MSDQVQIEGLSEALQGKLIIAEGAVVYSNEIPADDHELRGVISYAKRKGVEQEKSLPPEKFAKFYNKYSKAVSDSEVQEMAKNLIEEAHLSGASDLHIANHGSFSTVRARRHGMMEDEETLPANVGEQLINTIYNTMSQGTTGSSLDKNKRQDGRVRREFLPEEVHSVRVHTEPIQSLMATGDKGIFMALRLLYDITGVTGNLQERFNALGYTQNHISLFNYLSNRKGMLIFSGQTGSGKTTSLKHYMESQADENRDKAFMSIEDPPEYPMERVNQVHVEDGNYKGAIKGSLRSDPDVIMIGEIRDSLTALAALEAAQTGHSILASIHAGSALDIVPRFAGLLSEGGRKNPRDLFCDHSVCSGLVYQRLVPVLCPKCKLPITELIKRDPSEPFRQKILPKPVQNRLLKVTDMASKKEQIHVLGEGCEYCNGKGIHGQTVVAEVIATDHMMLQHLRNNDFASAHKHWVEEQKGESFMRHAISLIEDGKLDPFTVERRLGLPLTYDMAFSNYSINAEDLALLAGEE